MNNRLSVDEYRKLQGLPPRGHVETVRHLAGAGTLLKVLDADRPLVAAKPHHALGRLAPGEMNKTEARFERDELAPAKARGELAWYAFEAVKLRIAPRTFLTVDFFVLFADGHLEAIDVKGSPRIVEEDAKVKMKVAAAAFPFRFRYAFPRPRRLGGGWLYQEVGK